MSERRERSTYCQARGCLVERLVGHGADRALVRGLGCLHFCRDQVAPGRRFPCGAASAAPGGAGGGTPPAAAPWPGLLADCAPDAPPVQLAAPFLRQPLPLDGAGAPVRGTGVTLDAVIILLVLVVAGLLLAGCQTTDSVPEPRLLTGAPIQPICVVFCQINQSLVSHEKIEGDGVTATTTGGSVSGSQSRGAQ